MIAMCGCEQSNDAQSPNQANAPLTTAADSRVESPIAVATADKNLRNPEAQSDALQEVRTQIFAVQSQYDALRIERDRLAGQVASHQAEGEKKLAALKAQWSAFDAKSGAGSSDPAARERFAESARVEMESALMMDDEYLSQLQEADEKLRETQEQLNELRKREAALDVHD